MTFTCLPDFEVHKKCERSVQWPWEMLKNGQKKFELFLSKLVTQLGPLLAPLKLFNDGSLWRLVKHAHHRPTCYEILLLRRLCEALQDLNRNIAPLQANAVSINSRPKREKEFSVSCKAMQSIFDSREKLPRSVIHRIACMKIFRLCRKISQTWNWNWSTFQKIAILFDNEPEKLRNRCLKIFIISADDVFFHLISRAAAMVVAGTGEVHVEHFELDVSYVFRKVGVVHKWRQEGVKDLEGFFGKFRLDIILKIENFWHNRLTRPTKENCF